MNFTFKHHITHQDKAVSEKVNFFADVFIFTYNNYGNPGFTELENHRSLLGKIKFQLDNFTSHSARFIKHYFQNNYLSKNDLLIKNYYKDQWAKINALKIELFNDFSNETKRDQLNTLVTQFIIVLDDTVSSP